MTTKKLTQTAILAALALALSLLERLLPLSLVLPLPGVKLGLSNLVTLFALYTLGLPYAAAILLLRVVLGSVIGALSYVALYMLKTYIYQRFVYGNPADAVLAVMAGKLPASMINAVFAMIVAPLLYTALVPALRRANLLEKLG